MKSLLGSDPGERYTAKSDARSMVLETAVFRFMLFAASLGF